MHTFRYFGATTGLGSSAQASPTSGVACGLACGLACVGRWLLRDDGGDIRDGRVNGIPRGRCR